MTEYKLNLVSNPKEEKSDLERIAGFMFNPGKIEICCLNPEKQGLKPLPGKLSILSFYDETLTESSYQKKGCDTLVSFYGRVDFHEGSGVSICVRGFLGFYQKHLIYSSLTTITEKQLNQGLKK